MKSSAAFSYHYPLLTSLIVFFNTFFLLQLNAYGNQQISNDWITIVIFVYAFLSGGTFYLYHLLFRNLVNIQNWTVKKDLIIFIQLVIISAVLMLGFTFFYKRFVNPGYNILYLKDGRFIMFFVLISAINFLSIKFLDLTFYYRGKSKLQPQIIEVNKENALQTLTVQGKNQYEILTLFQRDFILAEASGNYVMIYFAIDGALKKELLRTSLGEILKQLENFPQIVKIHRSYVINKNNIVKINKGNRKILVQMRLIDFEVQVSKANVSVLEK